MIFTTITSLPWDLYGTFVVEERHGFNKQVLNSLSLAAWVVFSTKCQSLCQISQGCRERKMCETWQKSDPAELGIHKISMLTIISSSQLIGLSTATDGVRGVCNKIKRCTAVNITGNISTIKTNSLKKGLVNWHQSIFWQFPYKFFHDMESQKNAQDFHSVGRMLDLD